MRQGCLNLPLAIIIFEEQGNVLGLYRDNAKEHGNYYMIIGYILGLWE